MARTVAALDSWKTFDFRLIPFGKLALWNPQEWNSVFKQIQYNQSSQLAQFFTYKMKLQNNIILKLYRLRAITFEKALQ